MTALEIHPGTDSRSGVEDRLLALAGLYADQLGRRYDVQDADSCALRVIADLAARERWRATHDQRLAAAHSELLRRYEELIAADRDHVELVATLRKSLEHDRWLSTGESFALLRRCLREVVGTAAAARLRRDISSLHASALAEVETSYRGLLQPHADTPGAGDMVEAEVDLPDLQARLRQALPDAPDLRVMSAYRIQGGYSKTTLMAAVAGRNLPSDLVVRSDSGYDFAATSVADEYALLQHLWSHDIAVPQPLGLNVASGDAHAMMVVAKLDGRPFGSPFSAVERNADLNRQMARHLAAVHAVPISGVSFLADQGVDQLQQIFADIATTRRHLDETGLDVPIIDAALCWLGENGASVVGSRTLTHGDYGPHNLLAHEGRITAILDWEYARVGNPLADVCWARRASIALDTWESFLEEYEHAGGRAPTQQEVTFFSILASAQIGVSVLRTTSVLHRAPHHGIRTAAPLAERLRPLLLELDQLLETA